MKHEDLPAGIKRWRFQVFLVTMKDLQMQVGNRLFGPPLWTAHLLGALKHALQRFKQYVTTYNC
jgi:hypothetical protein